MQEHAIASDNVGAHANVHIDHRRFDKDTLVGLGMAVVMLVAMAGWFYALGWTTWQAFRWLTN